MRYEEYNDSESERMKQDPGLPTGFFDLIFFEYTEIFTVVGVILGLSGFILQFQAIRSVDWTVALAQLGTMGVMSSLRVWLRKGLTYAPNEWQTVDQHETDWLAMNMVFGNMKFWDDQLEHKGRQCTNHNDPGASDCFSRFRNQTWRLAFAYDGYVGDLSSIDTRRQCLRRGQQALGIRQRLGKLTKWSGSGSDIAKTTTAAINMVMKAFLSTGGTTGGKFV